MKYYNSCPACLSEHLLQIEQLKTVKVLEAMQIPADLFDYPVNDEKFNKIPETISFYRCQACGLEFANPMFIANGEFYAYMQGDEKNYYNERWEFHRVLKHISANRNILDIGCGEGVFLEMASNRGHNVVGIDFNQTALSIARSKKLEVYDYSLKELPKYIENNFDTVVFFHVIEHLEELEQFFYDLADLMPIGASLYLSCPSPSRYSQYLEPSLLVGQKEFWDYPPHHQTRWNKQAIKHLLQRMGWQVTKIETEPFDLRGVATKLLSDSLISKGRTLDSLPSINRKWSILSTMLKIVVPSANCSGLSMLCHARRTRNV